MSLFTLPTVKYIDVTNWSNSSAAATEFKLNGAQQLIVYGAPLSDVYGVAVDMAQGQPLNITVSISTGSAVNLITSLTQGTGSNIWVQNGTSYFSCAPWAVLMFSVNSSGDGVLNNNSTLSGWPTPP